MTDNQIQVLEKKLEKIQSGIQLAKDVVQTYTDLEQKLKREASEIRQEIKSLKGKQDIEISDHALVRYLERIAGVDVDGMKESIKKILQPMVSQFGDGKYTLGDMKAVVRNSVVVTIIDN